MLLAEFAVLLHGKLLFHFLLIALRVISDTSALRALHLRHVVLNLPHNLPNLL